MWNLRISNLFKRNFQLYILRKINCKVNLRLEKNVVEDLNLFKNWIFLDFSWKNENKDKKNSIQVEKVNYRKILLIIDIIKLVFDFNLTEKGIEKVDCVVTLFREVTIVKVFIWDHNLEIFIGNYINLNFQVPVLLWVLYHS